VDLRGTEAPKEVRDQFRVSADCSFDMQTALIKENGPSTSRCRTQ
jgi:hypothetical protein